MKSKSIIEVVFWAWCEIASCYRKKGRWVLGISKLTRNLINSCAMFHLENTNEVIFEEIITPKDNVLPLCRNVQSLKIKILFMEKYYALNTSHFFLYQLFSFNTSVYIDSDRSFLFTHHMHQESLLSKMV